jgi:hypothetical protein
VRQGETKLGARYVQRSRWCETKRLSPPGMWSSTGSEHEALGGPLGDVGTVEARKSRLVLMTPGAALPKKLQDSGPV